VPAALLLGWLLTVLPAPAQTSAMLEIEAPAAVRELLRLHLQLASGDADDAAERLRLSREAHRQAEALLAAEGWFSPAIRATAEPVGGRMTVRLDVEPGERARIEEVQIDFRGDVALPGDERARRVEALREGWPLPVGQPFRQQDWDAAKQALLRPLLALDYAAAAIEESRAEVDPQRARVRLIVVVNSGPPFTLGEIEVSGLETYDPALLDHYRRIEPGERYSQERLLALQSALQASPYFSSVLVDIDPDPAQHARVPVRVSVRESRPKRIGIGAGYSSNTGARVEASFRHANFLDRAWNLRTGLSLEQRRSFGFADVHLPPTAKDYRDSFGVLAEASDIQGLELQRVAFGAVRTRTRGRIETRLSLSAQRETSGTEATPDTTSQALTLNYGWIYRDVDNLLDPRHGYLLDLEAGGAVQALLSDQTFLRLRGRHQRYYPMGERDVLILRAELGYTVAGSRSGIPEDFLFRTGGAQTVRGYAYQSLGVREDGAVVGGRKLAVASAEYVHWFLPDWGAAAFADFGDAWDERLDARLALGYGLGARWRSPAGPLALDVGYGERTGQFQLHFSVAIAF
jgi:translocation and assembly module TamA